MNQLQHAKHVLMKIREETDSVLVAFSGGKDSFVTLDLCSEIFSRVVPFFLYVVKDISFERRFLEYAERRYNVEVLQYPHPIVYYYKRNGHYRLTMDESIRNVKWGDVEDHVRHETGIRWIAKGLKQFDSVDRRIMLRTYDEEAIYRKGKRVFPISKWTQKHVLAYMQLHRIPSPSVLSGSSTGIALVPWVLYEIYQNFPDDYARIRHDYPLIDNAIARMKMYGK